MGGARPDLVSSVLVGQRRMLTLWLARREHMDPRIAAVPESESNNCGNTVTC